LVCPFKGGCLADALCVTKLADDGILRFTVPLIRISPESEPP
jgi:hypothetical protein